MTMLVEKLPDDFEGPFDSDICGNDASNRENSQTLTEEKLGKPFLLRVHWRRDQRGGERFIGCYRLDLRGLLAGRYIYREKSLDGKSLLRLKIQHDGGEHWIRRTKDGPSCKL